MNEHKCNGRLKALKKTLSKDELKAAMTALLPVAKRSMSKILPKHVAQPLKVTPVKKVLGESTNTNTPPMSKLLKSSQKILAASHFSQSAARDLLDQLENSPTFKMMQKSAKKIRKKKQAKRSIKIQRAVEPIVEAPTRTAPVEDSAVEKTVDVPKATDEEVVLVPHDNDSTKEKLSNTTVNDLSIEEFESPCKPVVVLNQKKEKVSRQEKKKRRWREMKKRQKRMMMMERETNVVDDNDVPTTVARVSMCNRAISEASAFYDRLTTRLSSMLNRSSL